MQIMSRFLAGHWLATPVVMCLRRVWSDLNQNCMLSSQIDLYDVWHYCVLDEGISYVCKLRLWSCYYETCLSRLHNFWSLNWHSCNMQMNTPLITDSSPDHQSTLPAVCFWDISSGSFSPYRTWNIGFHASDWIRNRQWK